MIRLTLLREMRVTGLPFLADSPLFLVFGIDLLALLLSEFALLLPRFALLLSLFAFLDHSSVH